MTGSELEARAGGRFPLSGPVLAPPVVDAGPDVGTRRFGAGDRVRVREWHPPGHTRCPRYVRGKAGCVVIGKTQMPKLAIWPFTEPQAGAAVAGAGVGQR